MMAVTFSQIAELEQRVIEERMIGRQKAQDKEKAIVADIFMR